MGRRAVLELVKEFTGEIADLSYNEQTREISGSYKDDYNLMESIKKKLALKLKNRAVVTVLFVLSKIC